MLDRRRLLAGTVAGLVLPAAVRAQPPPDFVCGCCGDGGFSAAMRRKVGGTGPRWDIRRPISVWDRMPEEWRPVVAEAVRLWNDAMPWLNLVHVAVPPGGKRRKRGVYLTHRPQLQRPNTAYWWRLTDRGYLQMAEIVFTADTPMLWLVLHELAHTLGIWGHAPNFRDSVLSPTGWGKVEERPGPWDVAFLTRIYLTQPRRRRERIRRRRLARRRHERRRTLRRRERMRRHASTSR